MGEDDEGVLDRVHPGCNARCLLVYRRGATMGMALDTAETWARAVRAGITVYIVDALRWALALDTVRPDMAKERVLRITESDFVRIVGRMSLTVSFATGSRTPTIKKLEDLGEPIARQLFVELEAFMRQKP